MLRRVWVGLLLACGLASLGAWDAAAEPDALRRFALVVGANNGGKDRPELRYAISDARNVLNVLVKIGGIYPADSLLVIEPTRAAFLASLEDMRQKLLQIQSQVKKSELIVYYSGHSDEDGLLLGRDRVYYSELRHRMNSMPADVRIAILDSCSSGAFTRTKGGKLRSPFLENAAYDMKGYAIMTSSSPDETSQESDRLRGSFFTHALVSGMRGAADMSGDGRVTLNEAYQYAYSETLTKTERTLSGAQHPNYDIQMAGTGDVLMTDVRTSSAIVVLDKQCQGRFFIRDQNEHLVVELRKSGGRDMLLGLEAGDCTITNERDGRVYEAALRLEIGQEFVLHASRFRELRPEAHRGRGRSWGPLDHKFQPEGYDVLPWSISLFPDPAAGNKTIRYYVFSFLGERSAKLDGISFGIGPAVALENARGFQCSLVSAYVAGELEGLQITNVFNYCGGHMKGGQVSLLADICDGGLMGGQAGALFNYMGGPLHGGQLATVMNLATQSVDGVQIAGVLNVASGYTRGLQLSLVNVAENMDGLQVGVVNIAQSQAGTSIGLVNLADNGEISPLAWYDDLTGANLGFKFRVNYLYTILSVGSSRENLPTPPASVAFHFGGHFPIESFFLEADLGILHSDPAFLHRRMPQTYALEVRCLAGWRITPFSALFAGVGVASAFDAWKDAGQAPQPLYVAGLQFTP